MLYFVLTKEDQHMGQQEPDTRVAALLAEVDQLDAVVLAACDRAKELPDGANEHVVKDKLTCVTFRLASLKRHIRALNQ
jgi:hypothetical protein